MASDISAGPISSLASNSILVNNLHGMFDSDQSINYNSSNRSLRGPDVICTLDKVLHLRKFHILVHCELQLDFFFHGISVPCSLLHLYLQRIFNVSLHSMYIPEIIHTINNKRKCPGLQY